MKIALNREIGAITKASEEAYGLSEEILMENAGSITANVVSEGLGGANGKLISILAGTGNNGGDAFVVARRLKNLGARVHIFLLGKEEKMSPSAKRHFDICRRMSMPVASLTEESVWEKLDLVLSMSDGIVDGIIGTGLKDTLREDAQRLIEMINHAQGKVFAIDIPSGVESDTGEFLGTAVLADITVTFGLPKVGHFIFPGVKATGSLVIDDIGMPHALLEDKGILQEYLDDNVAKNLYPMRPLDAHKGSCGRVLVLAGSIGMTGAAAMSAMASLKVGAGIVTLAVPASIYGILAMKLTEVMVRPLPESKKGVLGLSALEDIKNLSEDFDTILIGPGLGRDSDTLELIRQLVASLEKPVVLDADALFAYKGLTDEFKAQKAQMILTPHLGEMATLLDMTVEDVRKDLLEKARQAALKWQSVVVLKSECTMIAFPNGKVYFTSKGNPMMATAGSGDVLAGAIAGLVKLTGLHEAALLGVYLHGLAGDIGAEKKGAGLTACDILNNIPQAALKLLA